MKKIVGLMVVAAALVLVPVKALAAVRDCNSNAIMWCGAQTRDEFVFKLTAGDGHNSKENLQAIYGQWGIDAAAIRQTVDGEVTKDGRVLVGGQVVATDAKSIGRAYMPGSVKFGLAWLRPTAVSFRSERLPAYVHMQNGEFKWAVITSCGNAVAAKAVPKPVPAPVRPQPTPPAPKPQPLPETGMDGAAAGALGTTGMTLGLRGLRRSKRSLRAALRRH